LSLAIFDRHARIAIDSNVLIYLLEGVGDLADRSAELLDGIADGRASGVMATVALAEICAGPAAAGQPDMVERYAGELTSLENVRLISLSAEIAVDAAVLRGQKQMSLADAIHLASATSAGATAFVTNDRRMKSTPRIEIAYLDDL
jgi:predicted nucleic acid-binding protein